MRIATTAQMREMDRQAAEDYHVPGLISMEHGALKVLEVLHEQFGNLSDKRISIVCGKGNNGGDGLAIARNLLTRFNCHATVWLSADPSTLQNEAAASYKMAKSYGVQLRPVSEMNLSNTDIVVDALFGTGIKGPVTGEAANIIQAINNSGKKVISVDVPSGLDADDGKAEGAVVRASLTVTFALPKYGMLDFPGADYVGELIISDIGMPMAVMENSAIKTYATEASDVARWLPVRRNNRDSNKGKFGHVLVIAGSKGFSGAPVMVAEATARTGAGLVTLAVPQALEQAVTAHVSPVVMTHALNQSESGTLSHAALESAFNLAKTATVVALGPGVGHGKEAALFVRDFVRHCKVPLVLDADALNILAEESDHGNSLVRARSAPTILTPHPGEMGRLLGISTVAVENDRRSSITQTTQNYDCVVLLKGAKTLSAAPDGRLYLNSTGNPGMATGGAGDVLTGVIASLLAQHLEPLSAAAAGAYVHGLAGDLVERTRSGSTGIIATDLIEFLPGAIAHCQQERVRQSL
jgi:hydroxyethylthiazole kinase-like uncharacterized protein yjeF